MQNLLRIKLDPQRGGASAIDFLRPCFKIDNWPSGEVEIWSSLNGLDWTKVEETGYLADYDSASRVLRVSLLIDLTEDTYLAAFDIDAAPVGTGYVLEKHDVVQTGWAEEAEDNRMTCVGWCSGSELVSDVSCGCAIYGQRGDNVEAGFDVKYPMMSNIGLGLDVAAAVDGLVRVGFATGLLTAKSCGAGSAILGLCETPAALICLDTHALAAMAGEAAVRKQKVVTLTGTSPEELD